MFDFGAVGILCAFLLCGPQLPAHASSCNLAQGVSPWSLDPFLGTYDMDLTQQINMVNFTGGVIGVPLPVVLGGERQVFNKTADGQRYQQFVMYNNPMFNAHSVFVLGEQNITPIPGNQFLTYTFTMLNATTLQGSYSWNFGNRVAVFIISFAFYTDASGFFDTVNVVSPPSFIATAPFNRVNI